MKIPSSLTLFEDKTFFILVAGRQDAVFYKTSDGSVQRLDAFKIPKPHYSDNEGESKKPASGVRMRSGTMPELRDENIINDFLRELKKRLKKVSGFDKIFILAPEQTKNKIKSALPKIWQKKVKKIIVGNFYHHHPLDILKKVAKSEKK